MQNKNTIPDLWKIHRKPDKKVQWSGNLFLQCIHFCPFAAAAAYDAKTPILQHLFSAVLLDQMVAMMQLQSKRRKQLWKSGSLFALRWWCPLQSCSINSKRIKRFVASAMRNVSWTTDRNLRKEVSKRVSKTGA